MSTDQKHYLALIAAGQAAHDVQDEASFMAVVQSELLHAADFNRVLLATATRGNWRFTPHDDGPTPPTDLLAEVLDKERAAAALPWIAVPLDPRDARADVLVVDAGTDADVVELEPLLASWAECLRNGLQSVRRRHERGRRVQRLEAILDITNHWNRNTEMEPLLVEMAEAATRLLEADRASIFLWDKKNNTLVARPALGVDGGELRTPDDRGVVGHVVQTGRPKRVDHGVDQDQIDRHVDRRLGYDTRTLVCVPLVTGSGELIGAFEVLNKLEGNFSAEDETALEELASHAATALENTQQREELLRTRRQMTDEAAGRVQLIGESSPIQALRSTVGRVADTDLAVLILGENGTGKEVVAQMVHYLSRRRDQPFIAVNCAAISETLLESELFGHEKGAFTDAHEARQGKFELAAGGTLFLDEIGDLSPGGQAKLLRVLEEKVVVRVGGSTPIHTDARVVAATNQDLAQMVRDRTFREDLFFRLNVVSLELPPLRDRGDDVLLLAEHFLGDFSRQAGRQAPKLTADARRRMRNHPWPGNIRELRNLMERLAYLTTEDEIQADDLAFILSPTGDSPAIIELDLPLAEATNRFQHDYIKKTIERTKNMSEAARRLGLHRSNLYRKMRQLDMHVDES